MSHLVLAEAMWVLDAEVVTAASPMQIPENTTTLGAPAAGARPERPVPLREIVPAESYRIVPTNIPTDPAHAAHASRAISCEASSLGKSFFFSEHRDV